MRISPIKSNLYFKGATININALSDTHGKLPLADRAYQTLVNKKNDCFEKEEKDKINYLILGGDWFISGGKKGFLSSPDKPLMKFQSQVLNKFISEIKEKYPKTKTIFVPGNHDFDGGVDLFMDTMKETEAEIIFSNLDFNNSPKALDAIKEGKFIDSKIDFVSDDKNKDKEYAILNLGIAPINMSYYQSDLEGLNLIDNINIAQKFIQPEQYEKTQNIVSDKIKEFKEKYPDGVVILTCHTGVNFADKCAENIQDINLILNGHEHKSGVRFVNNTPIIEMSQNFKKVINAKIQINDNGSVDKIFIDGKDPLEDEYSDGEIGKFYKNLFSNDLKPTYTLSVKNSGTQELSINNVRNKNSYLANFVVDAILDSINKKDETVQIFALNASSIRNGFRVGEKPTITPFNVSNCLNGINYNQGEIYISEVNGLELSQMVLDNFLFNQIDTEKNPLIHYAGLKINKSDLMEAYDSGKSDEELCKYVILKETNEPIKPDKTYKIANPEKFFIKSTDDKIKELKKASYPLDLNVHDAFSDYFKRNPVSEIELENRLY